MKTYTFKLKLHYPSERHPSILCVVHCPLEVFFDSLKQVKQFEELYKTLTDASNKEIPNIYITASDYLSNDGIDYISTDYILCKYNAIIECKSLTELLAHSDFYGLIDGYDWIRPIQKECFKRHKKKLKKAVK